MSDYSISQIDALQEMIKSQMIEINTCIPGTIESYKDGFASVLPTAKKRFRDGDVISFPVIPNVRVCWPSFDGGLAGLKGPIIKGDPCLLVFAQQAVDGSDDGRSFDLQDAYAVMVNIGIMADGYPEKNDTLTLFYGGSVVSMSKGNIDIFAGSIKLKGNVTVEGPLVQSGGELSSNGIVLGTHIHGGVEQGNDESGPPVP